MHIGHMNFLILLEFARVEGILGVTNDECELGYRSGYY